jgi:hypothetical protein
MEVTTLLQNLSRWCYINVCFVPKVDVQIHTKIPSNKLGLVIHIGYIFIG